MNIYSIIYDECISKIIYIVNAKKKIAIKMPKKLP